MKHRKPRAPLTDNVLVCARKQDSGKAIIWVLAAPSIRAEAPTIEKAEQILIEKVWERYEPDESFGLRYKQPANVAPDREGALIKVVPNEVAEATEPGRYFKKGFCDVCQSGQGGRNAAILKLKHVLPRIKSGALVRFQPYLKCGMRVGALLLHKRICDAIGKHCKPLVEFREVEPKSTEFYEVVSPKPIPLVVPSAKTGAAGSVCSKCGTTFIYAETRREEAGVFIGERDADLLRSHGAGAIGNQSRPSLCVTRGVLQRISNLKHCEGLLENEVGELAPSAVNKKPELDRIGRSKVSVLTRRRH